MRRITFIGILKVTLILVCLIFILFIILKVIPFQNLVKYTNLERRILNDVLRINVVRTIEVETIQDVNFKILGFKGGDLKTISKLNIFFVIDKIIDIKINNNVYTIIANDVKLDYYHIDRMITKLENNFIDINLKSSEFDDAFDKIKKEIEKNIHNYTDNKKYSLKKEISNKNFNIFEDENIQVKIKFR